MTEAQMIHEGWKRWLAAKTVHIKSVKDAIDLMRDEQLQGNAYLDEITVVLPLNAYPDLPYLGAARMADDARLCGMKLGYDMTSTHTHPA